MRSTHLVIALLAAVFASISVYAAPLDLEIPLKSPGQKSATVTIRQDLFNEVIPIVIPIAELIAPTIVIPDQYIRGDLPIIGNIEVASAKRIKIESMDIGRLQILLDQGKIRFQVDDVSVHVSTDVRLLGGSTNVGKVHVFVTTDVSGSVILRNNGAGALVADIQDVAVNFDRFDFNLPVPVAGDLIEWVNRLFNEEVRAVLSKALPQPIDDAITLVLNEALRKPFVFNAGVQGVPFTFKAEFVDEPEVGKDGLTASVAVSASLDPVKAKEFQKKLLQRAQQQSPEQNDLSSSA
ncbi:hypothetical protein HK102_013411 [Quaeritorhiza haematococci]|nr:hypothetical protein HK102_013411 [Quaeritorhiza haematococci]